MSASSSNLALEDGCVPTKVVIQLATQVVIPNYSRDFASIPLQDFKPSYLAMDDGSLLATPLISDFQGALLSLIILSVLLALFLRNVVVAGYYYFSRSKIIHDRRLFLALFLSQLVSPAGILPTMVSYFDRSGDCTVILRFERCIQFFSLSMLVYVVLGFKAYRVLEDSRAVLVVATILQLGATAVFGLELAGTEGHRRLSGSCNRNRIPITMVGSVSIQLAQVLFIAICFGIAILRARAETRGTTGEKRTPKPASPITKAAEKLGATGWLGQSAAQTPPRNSVVSRLTWVFPGMFDTLFHQVMRDELRFTCMIAVTSGVAIAFPLIGLNSKNGLSVQGWLCLPWCFISLVVIKTFDRALARHEEEVAQWMSPIPTTAGYSKETANGHSTSTLEFTPASELGGSSTASSNPFEDPHRLSTRSSAQLSYSTSIYATETEHSYTDSAYEVVEAHRSSSEKILSR